MDFLIEFVLELFLEVGVEASQNKKVPKIIRYILISFLVLFFIVVIGIIYLAAFATLNENDILMFIIFFGLATFILIAAIIKFKKAYIVKKSKN